MGFILGFWCILEPLRLLYWFRSYMKCSCIRESIEELPNSNKIVFGKLVITFVEEKKKLGEIKNAINLCHNPSKKLVAFRSKIFSSVSPVVPSLPSIHGHYWHYLQLKNPSRRYSFFFFWIKLLFRKKKGKVSFGSIKRGRQVLEWIAFLGICNQMVPNRIMVFDLFSRIKCLK